MKTRRIRKFAFGPGVLVGALAAAALAPKAHAAEAATGLQPLQEFRIAHCCHEPSTTVYVAPAYGAYRAPVYGVGPASVRGVSRRTSRRVSRRR